jgi:hypothetical protein
MVNKPLPPARRVQIRRWSHQRKSGTSTRIASGRSCRACRGVPNEPSGTEDRTNPSAGGSRMNPSSDEDRTNPRVAGLLAFPARAGANGTLLQRRAMRWGDDPVSPAARPHRQGCSRARRVLWWPAGAGLGAGHGAAPPADHPVRVAGEPLDQVELALPHAFRDAHRLLERQRKLLASGGMCDQARHHDQLVQRPTTPLSCSAIEKFRISGKPVNPGRECPARRGSADQTVWGLSGRGLSDTD